FDRQQIALDLFDAFLAPKRRRLLSGAFAARLPVLILDGALNLLIRRIDAAPLRFADDDLALHELIEQAAAQLIALGLILRALRIEVRKARFDEALKSRQMFRRTVELDDDGRLVFNFLSRACAL